MTPRPSFFLASLLLPAIVGALTIWPKPQSQTTTSDLFVLDPTKFAFNGAGQGGESPILLGAFKRYRGIIFLHSPAARDGARDSAAAVAGVISSCTVHVESSDDSLTLETNVSYTLDVNADGVNITAPTVYGAMYGLESFSQLVDRGAFVNGTSVSDFPRYQFRATMIDTSVGRAVRGDWHETRETRP